MFAGAVAVWNFAGLDPNRMPMATVATASAGMLLVVAAYLIALIGWTPGNDHSQQPLPAHRSR
jgi:hypothetical protein